MYKILVFSIAILVNCIWSARVSDKKVICYYDSEGNFRDGYARFENTFLADSLSYCTHLIYGYAGINPSNFKLVPLNEQFDVKHNNYRQVTNLKKSHPNLVVLLSVGGGKDISNPEKYTKVIEDADDRNAFIESALTFVKMYGFDGLDLAWQFPPNKPKKIRSAVGNVWSKVKHTFADPTPVDPKSNEHKQQFTAFIRELKEAFDDGLQISLSVIPNVNSSLFYDVRQIIPNLDLVNLWAFDYYTPVRNPKEADYPAPLHELIDRKYDENGNYLVQYWLQNGAPSNKLILGIPTFGRTWKMTRDSGTSGAPPISEVKGGGKAGPYTREEGLLSYQEICTKLNSRNIMQQQKNSYKQVKDTSGRHGTYAFRLPNQSGDDGMWIAYEDEETASSKGTFARNKKLGGVAVVDITLDDFRGLCTGDKFPILHAAAA